MPKSFVAALGAARRADRARPLAKTCQQMMPRSSFLAAVSAVAAASSPGAEPAAEQTFDAALVRADLDAVWAALIDVGAKPFETADRSVVEGVLARMRAAVPERATLRDAWLTIATLLGALNDGHVSLGFPAAVNDVPRAFPLRFTLDADGSLIVYGDHTNTIPVGSKLVAIGAIPAARVLEVFDETLGAQTPALKRARIRGGGAWPSIALFGFGPSYDVRYLDVGGTERDVTVGSMTATKSGAKTTSATPYRYKTLRDGTVGYIEYRQCIDADRFAAFLAQTFAAVRSANVRALVIDVRNNGGGDSRLSDALWSYVTTKPFKQYGGTTIKACDRIKREYGHDTYVKIYGEPAWNAADGTLMTVGRDPNADLVDPGPQPLRFTGPTYLLTSASTFSSGMSCALAAKDYGLATIVGEETGEPVNSTGEVYTYVTPGLGLQAYLTTKYFFAPKPHPDGQGVVPDVPVVTTTADVAARRDPVLERVFALIASAQQ